MTICKNLKWNTHLKFTEPNIITDNIIRSLSGTLWESDHKTLLLILRNSDPGPLHKYIINILNKY